MGKGSFGQTVKCFDHKLKELVAIKIIKNKEQFNRQGIIEVKLLNFVKQKDKSNNSNIVFMKTHFKFRSHLFIVFELLSINLYEVLRLRLFQGFSEKVIKKIAFRLLQ